METKKIQPIRIALTGGGTGGHIYPIIAVVEELQRIAAETGRTLDLRFIGAPGPHGELLERNDVRVVRIASAKLRRYLSLENILGLPVFGLHLLQSLWQFYWFMPDLLFSKGGTGALGPVLAAAWYRIPTLVHESDAAPGLTNLVSSRFARIVLLGFKEAEAAFPLAHELMTVGNPVRRSLLSAARRRTGREKESLGFDPRAALTLVLGGSQGSERINMLVAVSLEELLRETQLFHLTGSTQYEPLSAKIAPVLEALTEEARKRYVASPYAEDKLGDLLAASDLVVSRGGAGALAECAAFGAPMLVIPLPESAGNHQLKNARIAEQAGFAIVLEEDAIQREPGLFAKKVRELIVDGAKRAAMGAKAREWGTPSAASKIAQTIVELTSDGRRSRAKNQGES